MNIKDRVLIIDNYDSFTYNLYQYIGTIRPDVVVIRNDKITPAQIAAEKPSHIVISPGPGFPKDAGVSEAVISQVSLGIPVLGVCLGHQAIGECFGGSVVHAARLMHGKTSPVFLNKSCPLFSALPDMIHAGRYHSLIVDRASLPDSLMITAETNEGEIMGLMHKEYPIFGIQFHPESVMTSYGMDMIKAFLEVKV